MLLTLSHIIKRVGIILFALIIGAIIFFLAVNLAIIQGTKKNIFQLQNISNPLDIVIVLGASVEGLQLSPILQDRVETAIQLYQEKKVKKIFISGDNGKKYYNEVDAMEKYLRNRSIPAEDIITDKKGFTTFDSLSNFINNNKENNNFTNIGIITQDFHLPRALFIAKCLGIKTIGIPSDRAIYSDQNTYETREYFARIKAFFEVGRFYIYSFFNKI